MLKEGTKWELKSLKIAFLIFGIISLYFILDNIFLSNSEILLSHIFKWSVPVVWIPFVAIGYIYLNSKKTLLVSKNVRVNDIRGSILADDLLFDLETKKLDITANNANKIKANVNLK